MFLNNEMKLHQECEEEELSKRIAHHVAEKFHILNSNRLLFKRDENQKNLLNLNLLILLFAFMNIFFNNNRYLLIIPVIILYEPTVTFQLKFPKKQHITQNVTI